MHKRGTYQITAAAQKLCASTLLCIGVFTYLERTLHACGPLPDEILYPRDGDHDVPTNAQVIARSSDRESSYALRRLVDKADGGDGSATHVDVGLNVYQDTVFVPLVRRCRTQNGYTLCAGTAELQPQSQYALWTNDPTFSSRPLTFRTGDGPATPKPVPQLTARVTALSPAFDGGACESLSPATIELQFSSTGEPWILVPLTSHDGPFLIDADSETFTWTSDAPPACFRLEQMNWAGERSQADIEVCLPLPATEPHEAGVDAGATSHDAGDGSTELPDRDASARPLPDGSFGAPDPDEETPASDDGGCGCRMGTRDDATMGGILGLLVAALFAKRHRKHTRPPSPES